MNDPDSGPPNRHRDSYTYVNHILHREITELRQLVRELDQSLSGSKRDIEHRLNQIDRELMSMQRDIEEARPYIESAQHARGGIVSIQVLYRLGAAIAAFVAGIYAIGNVLGKW